MTGRRSALVLAFLAVFSVGYLQQPTAVEATGQLVTIQDDGTANNAKVGSGGRLFVDTEATATSSSRLRVDSEAGILGADGTGYLLTLAATTLSGELVLSSGPGNVSKTGEGIITGINVDVLPDAEDSVTVTLLKGSQIIWRGSTPIGGGHASYSFENGLYSNTGLSVTVVNPGGADVHVQVYGEGFGVVALFPGKPVVGSSGRPHGE